MKDPVYVTDVKERWSYWPWKHITLSIFEPRPKDFDAQIKWEMKYDWALKYRVHENDAKEARKLSKQLHNLKIDPLPDSDHPIIQRLKEIKLKNSEEITEAEQWGRMAIQMPGDWGPVGDDKKYELKKILTNRAHGKVLEAFCGFNSYIGLSKNITEVIALDFCKEALELYEYPERKRILYDLERVVNGEKMNFFEDGSFQTISITFGVNYLTDPVPVLAEFYRILSSDGQLLIVGGTTQGYADLLKQGFFKPDVCKEKMKAAGFSVRVKHLKSLKRETELGKYYLVTGKK